MCIRDSVYLVPYGQDDAVHKPKSLIAHMEKVPETLEKALEGVQLQPLLQ